MSLSTLKHFNVFPRFLKSKLLSTAFKTLDILIPHLFFRFLSQYLLLAFSTHTALLSIPGTLGCLLLLFSLPEIFFPLCLAGYWYSYFRDHLCRPLGSLVWLLWVSWIPTCYNPSQHYVHLSHSPYHKYSFTFICVIIWSFCFFHESTNYFCSPSDHHLLEQCLACRCSINIFSFYFINALSRFTIETKIIKI